MRRTHLFKNIVDKLDLNYRHAHIVFVSSSSWNWVVHLLLVMIAFMVWRVYEQHNMWAYLCLQLLHTYSPGMSTWHQKIRYFSLLIIIILMQVYIGYISTGLINDIRAQHLLCPVVSQIHYSTICCCFACFAQSIQAIGYLITPQIFWREELVWRKRSCDLILWLILIMCLCLFTQTWFIHWFITFNTQRHQLPVQTRPC